jgi:hypothetical protein
MSFYYSLKKAKRVVESNQGDINENGHYSYCVIEETLPGMYSYLLKTRKEWWFRFNHDINKYVPCEKPEEKRNTIAFGMG